MSSSEETLSQSPKNTERYVYSTFDGVESSNDTIFADPSVQQQYQNQRLYGSLWAPKSQIVKNAKSAERNVQSTFDATESSSDTVSVDPPIQQQYQNQHLYSSLWGRNCQFVMSPKNAKRNVHAFFDATESSSDTVSADPPIQQQYQNQPLYGSLWAPNRQIVKNAKSAERNVQSTFDATESSSDTVSVDPPIQQQYQNQHLYSSLWGRNCQFVMSPKNAKRNVHAIFDATESSSDTIFADPPIQQQYQNQPLYGSLWAPNRQIVKNAKSAERNVQSTFDATESSSDTVSVDPPIQQQYQNQHLYSSLWGRNCQFVMIPKNAKRNVHAIFDATESSSDTISADPPIQQQYQNQPLYGSLWAPNRQIVKVQRDQYPPQNWFSHNMLQENDFGNISHRTMIVPSQPRRPSNEATGEKDIVQSKRRRGKAPINESFEIFAAASANRTPSTSSGIVDNVDNDHQIWIVPEEDGFDPHKVAIDGIASCIRNKFELARPSWKKFPKSTREMWFEEFKKKFKWLPHYNDTIWSNFNKRASSIMNRLFQHVRKNMPRKPQWMGDSVFKEMKEYWESLEFKNKSEQNKKNRDSNAGASLHTSGCVPHLLIYKRMKEAIGKDPSISEFYFRTHKKKSDKSWVNEKAEATYLSNEFERKKQEVLATQSASVVKGETNPASQPSQLSEMDIWVQAVGGKRKGRVKGLGSLGRNVKASKKSTSTLPEELDDMIKS
ncbi:hypothetical protein P3S67_014103 [Capsicum chacoense]